MSLRKGPFNSNWVIIAPKREGRPNDFRPSKKGSDCPFCAGNEELTPPEAASLREEGQGVPDKPGWKIRVFDNLFPALTPRAAGQSMDDGLYCEMPGAGGHEVIVQTPLHDRPPVEFSKQDWMDLLAMYQQRIGFWADPKDIRYILIFQNYGQHSGASLMHPHNQLIATPVVPPRIQEELETMRSYHDSQGRCLYCDALERELEDGSRVIFDDEDFVALCPFASRMPYEALLLPRRHMPGLQDLNPQEVEGLAVSMMKLLQAYAFGLENPPYNYLFHIAPASMEDNGLYHWHLEFVPRLSTAAGFEWGSGIFINSVEPAQAAAKLKTGIRAS